MSSYLIHILKTRVSLVLLIGILIIGTIPIQEVSAASAPVGLGFLDPDRLFPGSIADGVSSDGSVIVGFSININSFEEAFRWTQGTGMQGRWLKPSLS